MAAVKQNKMAAKEVPPELTSLIDNAHYEMSGFANSETGFPSTLPAELRRRPTPDVPGGLIHQYVGRVENPNARIKTVFGDSLDCK